MPDPAFQKYLVAMAEANTPDLQYRLIDAVSVITTAPDEKAILGWRTATRRPAQEAFDLALNQGESLIFDFGEHIVGFPEFHFSVASGIMDAPLRVRFVFGETEAEVSIPFDPYSGKLCRSWLQDEVINIDVLPHMLKLVRRYAFRFVKIEVTAMTKWITLRVGSVRCNTITSAGELKRPLHTDAPSELAAIDAVAIRTLKNCMQTVLEDGPKRDRRLWIGDFCLGMLTSYVTCPCFHLARRCLYLFAGLAHEDGGLPACVYEKPEPMTAPEFILDYAMEYASCLADYYRFSHDADTVAELLPFAAKQFEFVLDSIDESGLFHDPKKYWIFIDWAKGLDKETALTGVFIRTAKQLMALAAITGQPELCQKLPDVVAKTCDAAMKYLLDAETGLFVSGPNRQYSFASQIWMVLAGVPTTDESRGILQKMLSAKEIIPPASPMLYHYFLEALLTAGMKDEAIRQIKHYWGGMVNLGATAFWETFIVEDPLFSGATSNPIMTSRCHVWGCTPAYFIREYGLDR